MRKPFTERLSCLFAGVKSLWERAKKERSTPRQIGFSVGVGAFAACTPFVGFHLGIAFVLATILRLSRLWAMVGSRMSTTPIFLATTFCEIEVAHKLRAGQWTALGLHDLARARELGTDWAVGTLVVGAPIAALAGLAAFVVAHRWQRVSANKLAARPLPSSESMP